MTPIFYPDCYFAQHAIDPKALDSCDGRMDRCHFLPQRTLKRLWAVANPRLRPAWFFPTALTDTDLQALLDDPRNWAFGCRRHHQRADAMLLDFVIPDSARQFACELDLSHHLPAREASSESMRRVA